MSPDRFVGTIGVRIFTIITGASFVYMLVLINRSNVPDFGLNVLAVVLGFLTFIGLVHWTDRLYTRWMQFAERMHTAVITILFGACYLLVVPVFFLIVWPFDPLRLRNRSNHGSTWVERRHRQTDLDSFRRMG